MLFPELLADIELMEDGVPGKLMLDYSRVEPEGGTAVSSTDFAFSAGIDLGFLSGLGIHAAYDWLRRDGTTFSTIGIGGSYSLKTPGF